MCVLREIKNDMHANAYISSEMWLVFQADILCYQLIIVKTLLISKMLLTSGSMKKWHNSFYYSSWFLKCAEMCTNYI